VDAAITCHQGLTGHADEQPGFHDSHDLDDCLTQPGWVGDRAKPAVQDAIAAIRAEQLAGLITSGLWIGAEPA
jgi:hypothetical protein